MQLGILKVQGSEAPSQVMSVIDFLNLLERMSKNTKEWVRPDDVFFEKGADKILRTALSLRLCFYCWDVSNCPDLKEKCTSFCKNPPSDEWSGTSVSILDEWSGTLVSIINQIGSLSLSQLEAIELFEIVDDCNVFLEHRDQHLKEVNDQHLKEVKGQWFGGVYKFELKPGPAPRPPRPCPPRPLINMRELRKNIPLISALVISSSLFLAAKYLISSKRKTMKK